VSGTSCFVCRPAEHGARSSAIRKVKFLCPSDICTPSSLLAGPKIEIVYRYAVVHSLAHVRRAIAADVPLASSNSFPVTFSLASVAHRNEF
jgi:hypothetical protein